MIQLNKEVVKRQIRELVRGSVEETLNALLEAETENLTRTARCEYDEQGQGYRSGHYSRNLTIISGDVTLKIPRLRGRGLDRVKLVAGDKCLGMLEAVGEVFSKAKCQRCTFHFYHSMFSYLLCYIIAKLFKIKIQRKIVKDEKAEVATTIWPANSGSTFNCCAMV